MPDEVPVGSWRLPEPQAVWAEAHAALLDHLGRRDPGHALRRLARSIAGLLDGPCAICPRPAGEAPHTVFPGGGWSAGATATRADWPLSHAGAPVGRLWLAGSPVEPVALQQALQPLLDTAAALLAALLEQDGAAEPASLSLVRVAMREAGTFVWEWDIATDVLGDIDEGAAMLGYESDAIGHTQADWNRLIHPDDAEAVEAAYQAHARGETPRYRALYRARAACGDWQWIEERGRIAARDAAGAPRQMVGTQTDATLQVALEQAQQGRLAAQAANDAKSQLLSRVSHELRTPLNAVMGFAQLLELDAAHALDATQQRRVALIRQAGDYLLAMIGDLLDLSLLDTGRLQLQLQPVPLAPLTRDALDLVRQQADEAGIRLHLGAWAGAGRVRADTTRLMQVLINLLTNAIKYNRPQGEVHLAVRADGPAHWLIEVRDTGPGIDPARRAELFQPFNRLGREHGRIEGSGLGLALSQTLVAAMHGTLHHVSPPGGGSLFSVRLPKVHD